MVQQTAPMLIAYCVSAAWVQEGLEVDLKSVRNEDDAHRNTVGRQDTAIPLSHRQNRQELHSLRRSSRSTTMEKHGATVLAPL